MHAGDRVVAEVDADRHVVQPVHPVDGGDRLGSQIVVAAGLDGDRELDRGGSETDPQSQEVGGGAAPGPQIDRAQLSPSHQVGQVGRGLQALDPLGAAHRLESLTLGDQADSERVQSCAEVSPPGATLLDRVGDHHDRRDERQRQEVELSRDGEHRDAGDEWRQHGKDLEPARFRSSRDRPDRFGVAHGDDRRPVRGAMEVDLPELIVVLVLAAFERSNRQQSAAQPEHVGGDESGGRLDRHVVEGDPVGGARSRMDDGVPGRTDLEVGVVARDGRVGDDQVHVGTATDRIPAGLQQVPPARVGSCNQVSGHGAGRQLRAGGARAGAEGQLVAGHHPASSDRVIRCECATSASPTEDCRAGVTEVVAQGLGEIGHRVVGIDHDDHVGHPIAGPIAGPGGGPGGGAGRRHSNPQQELHQDRFVLAGITGRQRRRRGPDG